MRVGVISDTHGMLRPEVFRHFEGVDHILHAGDVGPASILAELEAIAPVTAVWGNTDDMDIRAQLPEVANITLAGKAIVVVHGHQVGSPTPAKLRAAHPDADIIIFGHTHKPAEDHGISTLVLNPGSAGAPRFGLPLSVAILTLGSGDPVVEMVTWSSGPPSNSQR